MKLKHYINSRSNIIEPEFLSAIQNLSKEDRTIEITVELTELNDIESSNRIEHKDNIAIKDRFNAEQLQWYNDLIDNVYNKIDSYFKIIEAYQSPHSYSYYLEFEACTTEGESLGNFTIKFRISNHEEKSKTKDKNSQSNSGRTHDQVKRGQTKIFRSILVNEVSQKGMVDTIMTIDKICEQLLKGNLEVLDMLMR